MGSMFRSEKMSLCQMFIQPEAAYASVSELGETGTVQFRDLNDGTNEFQRKYVTEVRRCDELERKIRYIEKELKKDDIRIPDIGKVEPKALNPRESIDLEAHLEKTENEILELSTNEINLKSNFNELNELRQVLENTQGFFTESKLRRASIIEDIQQSQYAGQLGFVAGVIQREKMYSFERMLWRISRGNVFLRQVNIKEATNDPVTGFEIMKIVFVAFFQGDQLKSRIKKVCAGFRASLYPCPINQNERNEMLLGVRTRLEDLKMVLNQTEDHRKRVLVSVAKELPNWNIMVKKMKAIYHTLNYCNMDMMRDCLIAECWVPDNDLSIVQKALSDGSAAVGSTIPSFLNIIEANESPPTFNRTNKFTKGFQNLIDSYGIATYREVNPALYTIITFPFLFAVMYGDIGHGLIMTLFGLWMYIYEDKLMAKKSNNEIWNIFFGGRYIILLMGIFSMYTGFIYNDLFSKSMNIFQSSWRINYDNSTALNNKDLQLNPTSDVNDDVYPIGLDPVWQLADNKIVFLNTYKMKLSIIFGVLHMMFGVCMSVVNNLHYRKSINIILEFLPQIIFLTLMFGYMVSLMFIKWIKYSAKAELIRDRPGCAPSVLITFINMVLLKSSPPLDKNCVTEFMFDGQQIVQYIFLAISLICIPWMLLAKPLYVTFTRKPKEITHEGKKSNHNGGGGHGADDEEEEPLSEIYIHQAIHTIEYILGTVSHTASYLRLWALSLAHAQLAEVVYSRVFAVALHSSGYGGSIMIYIIFAIWAFLTIAILVLIEGLSAFLHTLRLHWVEFMSKFYIGLGYAFEPFCFKTILAAAEDENIS